jgi:hypothetical protein
MSMATAVATMGFPRRHHLVPICLVLRASWSLLLLLLLLFWSGICVFPIRTLCISAGKVITIAGLGMLQTKNKFRLVFFSFCMKK